MSTLPSQRAHIPFTDASGQNEASHTLVDPGPVMSLINGEYDHDDSIAKRRGFQSLGSVPSGMLAHQLLSAGAYGGVVCNDALLGIGVGGVDPVTYKRLEHAHPVHASSAFLHGGQLTAGYGAVAVSLRHLGVVTAFAADSEAVIVERATGAVKKRVALPAAGFAQVVSLSGLFLVYYLDGGSGAVKVVVINPLDVTTGGYAADSASAAATIFTPDATNNMFVATTDPGGGVLFAFQKSGGGLKVAQSTDGVTFAASHEEAGVTDCESFAITRNTVTQKIHVVYGRNNGTGGGAWLTTIAADFSLKLLGPTRVLDAGGTNERWVPGIAQPAHGSRLYITGNCLVDAARGTAAFATCLDDHTSISATSVLTGCMWLSAPVTSIASVNSTFNSGTYPERCFGLLEVAEDTTATALNATPTTYWVMLGPNLADSGLNFGGGGAPSFLAPGPGAWPVAMVNTDEGPLNPRRSTKGSWLGDSGLGDEYTRVIRGPLPMPARDDQTYYVPTAVLQSVDAKVSLNVNNPNRYANRVVVLLPANSDVMPSPRLALGASAYLGGGLLSHWDGVCLAEQTPMQPVAPAGSGAGGHTYDYRAVEVWEDVDGDLHRSAPSPAVRVLPANAIDGTHTQSLTWPDVLVSQTQLTLASQARHPLYLEVYRTKDGGATFYLQSVNTRVSGAATTVVDGTTDSDLGSNRILYTDGGILPAEQAPASADLVAHQDRLWLIDAVHPNTLWFSKVRESGIDFEFNAALTLRLDGAQSAVALSTMDDKLLVFTDRECQAVVGQGPDATGAGAFTPPEVVAKGIVATGRHSVLSTPVGVFVHTKSGFKLLGRDLSVTDVGKLLTDSAPGTITVKASAYFPARQQAWFLLSNQYVAVFDHARDGLRCYLHGLAAGLNSAALDLADIGGVPHLLSYNTGDGKHYVYRLDEAKSDDAGQFQPMVVQTGWFRPGGDTGLQDSRFRVLHVYGTLPDAGTAKLKVGVEVQGEQHSALTAEEATFTVGAMGITNPVHIRMRLKRQRGYAARVTLTQVAPTSGNDTRGFQPFGIEWEYGTRAAPTKVGAAGNAGA